MRNTQWQIACMFPGRKKTGHAIQIHRHAKYRFGDHSALSGNTPDSGTACYMAAGCEDALLSVLYAPLFSCCIPDIDCSGYTHQYDENPLCCFNGNFGRRSIAGEFLNKILYITPHLGWLA